MPPDAVQICTKLLSEFDSTTQLHLGLVLMLIVNVVAILKVILQNQAQMRFLKRG